MSLLALFLVLLIGLPLGTLASGRPAWQRWAIQFSQSLRVIPSLGLLFILIPFLGTGLLPALVALTFLGLPAVLVNTILGFTSAPREFLETGLALGMDPYQLLWRVRLPEAAPYVLNGIKIALVEIMAAATLGTYIGTGGLGVLIFAGLGLYRLDLLLIGALSVTIMALLTIGFFNLSIRLLSH